MSAQLTEEPANLAKLIKKLTANGLPKGSRLVNPDTLAPIVIPDLASYADVNALFAELADPYSRLFMVCSIMNREVVASAEDIIMFPHEAIAGHAMFNSTWYPQFSAQKPLLTLMFKMPDTANTGAITDNPKISSFQKEVALSDIVVEYEILGESPRR